MDESKHRAELNGRLLLWASAAIAVCLIACGVVMMPASSALAQDDTTTTPADDEPGTTPVSGRQPIVENQFTTTSTGSLSERRPGLYVQQGIAAHNGELEYLTGDVPDEELSFYAGLFNDTMLNVIDMFGGILEGFQNLLSIFSGGSGNSSGLTFVLPSNAVTSWSNQSTTLP
jgi:hypothetical protein